MPTAMRTQGTRPPPPTGWASSAAASALTSPAEPASGASSVLIVAPPFDLSYPFHRSAAEEAGRAHQQHHEDQHQGQRHLDAVEEVDVLDGEGVGDAHDEPGDDRPHGAVEAPEGGGGE